MVLKTLVGAACLCIIAFAGWFALDQWNRAQAGAQSRTEIIARAREIECNFAVEGLLGQGSLAKPDNLKVVALNAQIHACETENILAESDVRLQVIPWEIRHPGEPVPAAVKAAQFPAPSADAGNSDLVTAASCATAAKVLAADKKDHHLSDSGRSEISNLDEACRKQLGGT